MSLLSAFENLVGDFSNPTFGQESAPVFHVVPASEGEVLDKAETATGRRLTFRVLKGQVVFSSLSIVALRRDARSSSREDTLSDVFTMSYPANYATLR